MFDLEVLAVLVDRSDVAGDRDTLGEGGDRGGAELALQTTAGEPGRHGVVGLTHTDPRTGIDPARERRCRVEGLGGQRPQAGQLARGRRAHGLDTSGDPPLVVLRVSGGHEGVHQVVPCSWQHGGPISLASDNPHE